MMLRTSIFCFLVSSLVGSTFNRATLPYADCAPTNLTVSASFLLWQSKMWGLEFAGKSSAPNLSGATELVFEEKLFVPDFAWHPGFKLILGAHLPYDCWDLRAGWIIYRERITHLKKHFHSLTEPPGLGIIPLWQYPFLQIISNSTDRPLRYKGTSGHWHMTFNSLDLELGRSFLPESSLPMRLSMGAKLATIQQKYRAYYDAGTTVLALSPEGSVPSFYEFISSRFQFKSEQFGIGPRLGLQSYWHLVWGLNLIAHGGFSLLGSFFTVKSGYHDLIEPTPGPCKMRLREHFTELTPVCEAMLGFDWGTCFRDKYYFGITVGYEWQYWWAANHARRNYVQTLPGETVDMRGELQMQGLNGAIKCDF